MNLKLPHFSVSFANDLQCTTPFYATFFPLPPLTNSTFARHGACFIQTLKPQHKLTKAAAMAEAAAAATAEVFQHVLTSEIL